ncbi:MAG: LysR family transcriptional regulator [Lachnospiraceae bacterium]|nr:LysR family transcriptional regulator [Lachnospiraceae bacterium]
MEYRQLEYYIAVFEQKNLTAAAKQLSITQQGLSKTIQKLEQELEMPLFLRVKNHLIPTEFGELVYREARRLVNEYKKTMDVLEEAKRKHSNLKIGFASNVMGMFDFELLMAGFKKEYPDISVEIFNETDFICEEKLLKGELDAAFCVGPFSSQAIKSYFLTSELLYVLVNQKNPLAERDVLKISDIGTNPVIAADSKNKGYMRLFKIFQEKGVTPNVVLQSSDPIIHLKFVERNTGVSVFPGHWRSFFSLSDSVKAIPLCDIQRRNLYLITNAGNENKMEIRRFVRAVCGDGQSLV